MSIDSTLVLCYAIIAAWYFAYKISVFLWWNKQIDFPLVDVAKQFTAHGLSALFWPLTFLKYLISIIETHRHDNSNR